MTRVSFKYCRKNCCSRVYIRDNAWLANLFSLWINNFNAQREGKDHLTRSSLALAFCPRLRQRLNREREREREGGSERERQREERERETKRERRRRAEKRGERRGEDKVERRERDERETKRERREATVWISLPASARPPQQWRFELLKSFYPFFAD